METIAIKGNLRTETGKSANKQLRSQKLVPCVLYGAGENVMFSVDLAAFRPVLSSSASVVVDLELDSKNYTTIVRELQFDPISDDVIHADFYRVTEDKPVVVTLPLVITGHAEGVRQGGKLAQLKRKIKVKGLVSKIPTSIEVDVTTLGIGKSIRAGELQLDGFEVAEVAATPLVSVKSTRAAREAGASEEAAE